ncbi:hypothetical protein [Hyphobacterium sp.]|uniref:hypothetical protein n=1 Tax=Hyphobacterium sp. TaxID=2004662 RepID=UPI003748EA70
MRTLILLCSIMAAGCSFASSDMRPLNYIAIAEIGNGDIELPTPACVRGTIYDLRALGHDMVFMGPDGFRDFAILNERNEILFGRESYSQSLRVDQEQSLNYWISSLNPRVRIAEFDPFTGRSFPEIAVVCGTLSADRHVPLGSLSWDYTISDWHLRQD